MKYRKFGTFVQLFSVLVALWHLQSDPVVIGVIVVLAAAFTIASEVVFSDDDGSIAS